MTAQNYLSNEKFNKKSFSAKRAIVILLSILAITGVFWWLKLIGITMAGEAFCGMVEHVHTEECAENGCDLTEHIHIATCYSNPTADVETKAEWESTMSDVELTGVFADDLVAIAKTQLGYQESTLNYTVGSDGITRGYTRYGAWYGNEYGDWSSMFAGFCLNYAGINSDIAPYNSGAETMKMLWSNEGMFNGDDGYSPLKGDLVFIDKDENGKADSVGIVIMNDSANIMAIEGDINNTVERSTYSLDDKKIIGYGVLNEVLRKTATENELEYIDMVIALIDEIPEYDAFYEKLAILEDDMDSFEQYYLEVTTNIRKAYIFYEDLNAKISPLVTNSQKLIQHYESLGAVSPFVTVNQTGSYMVFQSNVFDWASTGHALTISGQSVDLFLSKIGGWANTFYFSNWVGFRIEVNAKGEHYVAEIRDDTRGKRDMVLQTSGGFFLMIRPLDAAGTGASYTPGVIKVGDSVNTYNHGNYADRASFYTLAFASPSNSAGTAPAHEIGGVIFGAHAKLRDTYNNLTPVQNVPDTSSFIEINLHNYGVSADGSTNINTPFNNDASNEYPYPIFTRSNTMTPSGYTFGTSDFAFGDWVVADFGTAAIKATTRNGINRVPYGYKAITGYMMPTLQNGFPALKGDAGGSVSASKSLRYLFSDDKEYVYTQNKSNITGLFQYDAAKQMYYYDSRNNHAQYDKATNKFVLYNEKITPNYVMYPFGNFMPFNSITTQATNVNSSYASQLRDTHLLTAASAMSRYNITGQTKYYNMSLILDKVIAGMDNAYGGTNWKAMDMLKQYDSEFASLVQTNGTLNNLYNIDYDEDSDFFFGMDIHFDFFQPNGGLTGENNDPMIFEFAGDDDVWVYIDDVLFLDLSGIHSHVGGKIDFKNGKVYYYAMKDFTGAVYTDSDKYSDKNVSLDTGYYEVHTFEEILTAAGRDASILTNGTFGNYSNHSLDFYYMERGSGSSICSINFNMPVLAKNRIEISKEVRGDSATLGDPDYLFMVVNDTVGDANRWSSFVPEGTAYSVYDTATMTLVAEKTVEAGGIIRIKNGQTAVIGNIAENSGQYFIRELFEPNEAGQYSSITMTGPLHGTEDVLASGFATVTINGKEYKAVASGNVDASIANSTTNGAANFKVVNTLSDSSTLTIEKVLTEYPYQGEKEFEFELSFDGIPVPVGTSFEILDKNGNVTGSSNVAAEGIVKLTSGTAIRISGVIAGSEVYLKELNSDKYVVTYTVSNLSNNGMALNWAQGDENDFSGKVPSTTSVGILVANDEEGVRLSINGTKELINPDGISHSYTFLLEEVSKNGDVFETVDGGKRLQKTVTLNNDKTVDSIEFVINYATNATDKNKAYYYRISEIGSTATNGQDTSFFILTVTFDANGNPIGVLQKNGVGEALSTFEFKNLTVRKLKVTKTVEGTTSPDDSFDFKITALFENEPLNGDYLCAGAVGSLIFVNGEATVSLKNGEYFEIIALPYGTEFTVYESKDGYYTEYRFDTEAERSTGNEVSANINSDLVIHFYNIGGSELPSTGSYAREIFPIIGGAIILLAFALACVVRYHRKKRV